MGNVAHPINEQNAKYWLSHSGNFAIALSREFSFQTASTQDRLSQLETFISQRVG